MHLEFVPALGASATSTISVEASCEAGDCVVILDSNSSLARGLQNQLLALCRGSARIPLAAVKSAPRGISLLGGGGRVTDKAWSRIVPGPGADRR